jgi:hypothetical protein
MPSATLMTNDINMAKQDGLRYSHTAALCGNNYYCLSESRKDCVVTPFFFFFFLRFVRTVQQNLRKPSSNNFQRGKSITYPKRSFSLFGEKLKNDVGARPQKSKIARQNLGENS